MLISVLILLLITLGGTILTYLYDEEDSLLVRICAGNVIGSAVFALIAFILACLFEFSVVVVLVSLVGTMLPLGLLKNKNIYKSFQRDWKKAKGKLEGTSNKKLLNLVYYAGIFLLLYFFFDRAFLETKVGIFTGAMNNLGDLPFHLAAIYGFTDGQNFPPENPSFSGVRFTYPFIADFIVACMMRLGAGVRSAMFWQNVFLGFSLAVLLENFTFRLTQSKLAGRIAPLLLFFSGGLGFFLFFRDLFAAPQGWMEFLWKIPNEYTIRFTGGLRWGNSLTTLFITQRSFLLGMPLTLIVLTYLWKIFTSEKTKEKTLRDLRAPFFVGIVAGFLPLIHVHSLLVLFWVSGWLVLFSLRKWRQWLAFLIGTTVIAVPELLWSLSGSATRAKEFIDWHFGWDSGDMNFFIFWLKNTGLLLPLLLIVLLLMLLDVFRTDGDKPILSFPETKKLLLFYVPFAMCFVISNVVKLAPWEWDNIKVLIYWFVGSIPVAALLLARIWKWGKLMKAAAAAALLVLIFSGALDVWRVISGAIELNVFDKDAVKIAADIRQTAEPRAIFLNPPTYNNAVVLTGRRSLLGYPGHLSSHGIDFAERQADVRKIYTGTPTAEMLMKKYNIDYVLTGPGEIDNIKVNQEFFNRFPLVAEEGGYRVYKIKR